MIEEIKKEIEEKYVRKFAFNDERQFIFYDDLLFLLDKYNNQSDYKSAWENLKRQGFNRSSDIVAHDYLKYMKELEQKYNIGDKNE